MHMKLYAEDETEMFRVLAHYYISKLPPVYTHSLVLPAYTARMDDDPHGRGLRFSLKESWQLISLYQSIRKQNDGKLKSCVLLITDTVFRGYNWVKKLASCSRTGPYLEGKRGSHYSC